ncbi:hypothetical protein AWRI1631_162990 [Saccharomyces cerevisiae AWRI1631]|uniref:Uncharacterized protein n=1 Tax=Saccharomyces cerevisiae (strain AWRI1631) TaxID=545124 RepID=B5VTI9_YEAS6|nr:hypothetical protein AWRI1631_162990 [Saccharomyces cerevisiae AWRI1631]
MSPIKFVTCSFAFDETVWSILDAPGRVSKTSKKCIISSLKIWTVSKSQCLHFSKITNNLGSVTNLSRALNCSDFIKISSTLIFKRYFWGDLTISKTFFRDLDKLFEACVLFFTKVVSSLSRYKSSS